MNFKVIKQLYKKEILDVLRDKKTIIMMVIVPLLIYPLMFVGGMVMMSKVTTQMDTQTYEIAVDFMDTNPELVEMFLHPDDDTLHFKLCDLNVMDADISMILRGEKINAIVYENEDGTGYNIAYEFQLCGTEGASGTLSVFGFPDESESGGGRIRPGYGVTSI